MLAIDQYHQLTCQPLAFPETASQYACSRPERQLWMLPLSQLSICVVKCYIDLDQLNILQSQDRASAEEFDMRWVAEFVDKLSTFDCEMNLPVIESELLEGIPQGKLSEAGERICPNTGWKPGFY